MISNRKDEKLALNGVRKENLFVAESLEVRESELRNEREAGEKLKERLPQV